MCGGRLVVVKAFTESRRRQRWLQAAARGLVTALSTALTGSTSKEFAVKPNGQARMRYKWDDTIVEVYLAPKAGGKSSIVAVSKKLGNATLGDERRGQWRSTLAALASSLGT